MVGQQAMQRRDITVIYRGHQRDSDGVLGTEGCTDFVSPVPVRARKLRGPMQAPFVSDEGLESSSPKLGEVTGWVDVGGPVGIHT